MVYVKTYNENDFAKVQSESKKVSFKEWFAENKAEVIKKYLSKNMMKMMVFAMKEYEKGVKK